MGGEQEGYGRMEVQERDAVVISSSPHREHLIHGGERGHAGADGAHRHL